MTKQKIKDQEDEDSYENRTEGYYDGIVLDLIGTYDW
jgi:hypothetical protein